GAMYVGGVCSAATSQSTADLKATVMQVNHPSSATPTFTTIMTIPLTYDRINRASVNHTNTSDWQPWPTAATINDKGFFSPVDNNRGTRPTGSGPVALHDESYPELTGIGFDADGSMLLSLRDLMGDMAGRDVPGEGSSDTAGVTVQGDLLRAAP